MSTTNDAVNIHTEVELDWYKLGGQFGKLNNVEQHEFLAGMVHEVTAWDTVSPLYQMDEVVKTFNELSPELKKPLIYLLESFKERLEQGESNER